MKADPNSLTADEILNGVPGAPEPQGIIDAGDDTEPTDEDLEEIEDDEDPEEPLQLAVVCDGQNYSVFDVVSGRPVAGVESAVVRMKGSEVKIHLVISAVGVGAYPPGTVEEQEPELPRTL
jgi:hypothetical protein